MPTSRPSNVAVILAGAVAKGAFEAGVLQVVAERGLPVRRIVASSSGALNGTVYAAGVRARREQAASQELASLWREQGSFFNAVHPSLLELILRFDGIGTSSNLLHLLQANVRPHAVEAPAPIELRIVVAPLNGFEGAIGDEPATTYERALLFSGEDFDSPEGLARVFNAAVASSAFPGVFAPVEVEAGVGACLDGGVVNNTPIDYALDEGRDPSVEAVLVIAPTPAIAPPQQGRVAGLDLLSRLVDLLINERLYRDLRRTENINESLRELDAIARVRGWGPEDVEAIKNAVRWGGRRHVEIVSIRPLTTLPGNSFTGFFDRDARDGYLEAGRQRATQVLDDLGW